MEDATPSTMRRDIVSAYVASGAKIASWVVVAALLYRANQFQYAVFALVRGTIGLLNYTVLGLAPAMISLIAGDRARQPRRDKPLRLESAASDAVLPLDYAAPPRREVHFALATYSNAAVIVSICATVGFVLIVVYAWSASYLHAIPWQVGEFTTLLVVAMGVGILFRLVSDVPGAVTQSSGAIATDNWCLAFGELFWVLFSLSCIWAHTHDAALAAAYAFALSGAVIFILRWRLCVQRIGHALPDFSLVNGRTIRTLISFGSMVTIAQLADFLYASTDFILISRLINTSAIADYAPAVQIDAGLLVIVAAIASVLLPNTANAHAERRYDLIRKYYLRGTIVSASLLLITGLTTWLLSPWIFRFWLGTDVPLTRAILPLMLIHTVVGGSSAVGRSILLGMGKVKPFTISVLIAGVSNVVLSYVFVRYFDLGLRGIVLGTIIAVVARCAIWMPWYVMRTFTIEAKQSGPARVRSGPA